MEAAAIISCYKAKEFLPHKIRNIQESDANIQIIVVECNGGRELPPDLDSSIKVIVFDKRITIWRAMNIGIQAADCEFVIQSNTDDLVAPSAYGKQITELRSGSDIAYFDYHVTHGFRKTWDAASNNSYCKYKTPANGYSVGNGLGMFPMWRKSLHDEVGYFDDKLEVYGDSLFWTKLVEAGKKFGRVDGFLGAYAQRPGDNLESRLGQADRNRLHCLRKLRPSRAGVSVRRLSK